MARVGKGTTQYFLCDLLATYTLRRLVRLAKCRWKIEQDYQQLREELGLNHCEGRSWIGWHHHTTLVMLADAFLISEMLHSKKTSGWT
jgi:SRSO17 transposase